MSARPVVQLWHTGSLPHAVVRVCRVVTPTHRHNCLRAEFETPRTGSGERATTCAGQRVAPQTAIADATGKPATAFSKSYRSGFDLNDSGHDEKHRSGYNADPNDFPHCEIFLSQAPPTPMQWQYHTVSAIFAPVFPVSPRPGGHGGLVRKSRYSHPCEKRRSAALSRGSQIGAK
jgi:hypothetical protein